MNAFSRPVFERVIKLIERVRFAVKRGSSTKGPRGLMPPMLMSPLRYAVTRKSRAIPSFENPLSGSSLIVPSRNPSPSRRNR